MTYNKKTEALNAVQEPAAAQEAIKIENHDIPLDENGVPIGIPWEVVLEAMYDDLSEHYGVDLRTL
ncbi:MAG: hypothetical protein LBF08_03565 [Dysgonamonadaceae bacterium]|jgi:hypothetical protein|nr:hypothetical protein [Dysgonamonadaceae bacterium]